MLCKGTEDETVIKRLNAKTISQDSLIEAVKTKIRTIKEKTQNKKRIIKKMRYKKTLKYNKKIKKSLILFIINVYI